MRGTPGAERHGCTGSAARRCITPSDAYAFPTSTCKFLKIQSNRSFVFFSRNFNFYPPTLCKNVAGTTHFASSLRLSSSYEDVTTRFRADRSRGCHRMVEAWSFANPFSRQIRLVFVSKDERRIHSSSIEVKRIAVEKVRDKQYRCDRRWKESHGYKGYVLLARRSYSHARILPPRFDSLHPVCLG